MKWTPDVFWKLSMFEFIAAMKGIEYVNTVNEEVYDERTGNKKLDQDDYDDLMAMLAEDAERSK